MRELIFLFPEIAMQQGGHNAQMAFLKLCQRFYPATAVTYGKKSADAPYLDDLLKKTKGTPDQYLFVIHWGPDISGLLKRLSNYPVVYIAHSTGWNIKLPKRVPIIAVSQHTQAYWGRRASSNPIYRLPNIIDNAFHNTDKARTIDILIMKRKSSRYVLNELLPLLKAQCRVQLIEGWVDDLASIMRSSKVFLYDSSDYWKKQGLTEGFGLPPLEALASGCTVFSSLNDALSDYLDPGFNCQQLGLHSAEFDSERILRSVKQWTKDDNREASITAWREKHVASRIEPIFLEINSFFDHLFDTGKPEKNNKNPMLIQGFNSRD